MGEGSEEIHRVRALLECWADWRGSVSGILLRHMRPRCTLGRLVRAARQSGEIFAHNEIHEPELPDDLMAWVDRIVCTLPDEQYRALRITYVEGRHWTYKRRARAMRMGKSQYYAHLRAAHEAVAAQIDWRNVLIV